MKRTLGLMAMLVALLVGFASNADAQTKFDSLRISEVSLDISLLGNGEPFELCNPTGAPIDTTGWQVAVYDPGPGVFGTVSNLPSLMLGSGEVIVGSDVANFPATVPAAQTFTYSLNYSWLNGGGLVLLDPQGDIVDAVFFGTATPAAITAPKTIGSEWTGANLPALTGNQGYRREGSTDSNSASDWNTMTPGDSIGTFNTNLIIASSNDWTGTVSTDWNNPGNWSDNVVPDAAEGALIPDAATTPNDPTLPLTGACDGLTIEAGGILIGGNIGAVLKVNGDYINEGGTYIPGNAIIELTGDADQNLESGGQDLGNIRVLNTMGKIIVADEWTLANTGTITMVVGTEMEFQNPILNFTNNTFFNSGKITLGLTNMGVTPATQTITCGGTNIGNTTINVVDLMDTVNFADAAGVGDMTITGMGNLTFGASAEVNGATDFGTFGGVFTVATEVTGSGTLLFNQTGDFAFNSDVTCANLDYTGAGNLSIAGDLTASANVDLQPIGPLAAFTANALLASGDVTINFMGTTAAMINGNVTANTFTANDGGFTATGSLTANAFNFDSADPVTFTGAGSSAGNADIKNSGALSFDSVDFASLTTAGSAGLTANGDVNINADVNSTTTGSIVITGDLNINGNGPQTVSFESGVQATRGVFTNVIGVNLSGEYWFTSTSGFNPAFQVEPMAGVVLENGTRIEMGDGANGGLARIQGAVVSSTGDSSTQRPTIAAHATAGNGRVVITATAVVNIQGMIFENIGNAAFAYGVDIQTDANLLAFNFVEFTNSQALTAAIGLGTQTLPGTIRSFHITGMVGGGNIDATAINGLHVTITEAAAGGGNLYGVVGEIDPNSVLFWDNPPVIDITQPGGPTLPNALVGNAYSFNVQAVGGNQPLTWSIANAPDWMSINAVTGELGGTPDGTDIGSKSFVIIAADSSTPQNVGNKVVTITVDSLTQVELVIISNTLLDGRIGEQYGFTLAASGGTAPYSWSEPQFGQLPPGLSLSQSGQILGSPTQQGVFGFQIRVRDAGNGTAIKLFTIQVLGQFNDPATVNAALGDGAGGGGGCAINGSTNAAWLMALLSILAIVAYRRRQQA